MKSYKLFTLISVFFVSVLLISNIVSTKLVSFRGFTFDGGTLLFPLSYIFWDVLTEVYGYKQSRKTIWMWFWALILMIITIIGIWLLPASSDWTFQQDYNNILWLAPRIAVASLIAFFAGEFSNSYILAKIKIAMKGKKLWVRTIGSTLVGQLVDTLLFVSIAFYWIYSIPLLGIIFLSNYIFKVMIEIAFTPLTYLVIKKTKKIEDEDYYDLNTDFNPLKIQ